MKNHAGIRQPGSRYRAAGQVAVALVVIAAGVGCQPAHPPLSTLQSAETVLAEYNAAAARVPRLWARAEISYKESASSLPLHADGLLALRKSSDPSQPPDFFLKFSEAGEEIGRLGVSTADGAYYAWFRVGERQGCRWGRLALAGAPGVEDMPIDPTQLPAVLSICELPVDAVVPPFVAQRISFDPCAYVLTYVSRQPISGRFLFRRELYLRWAVGEPRRAFRTDLLDENGLAVLTADLRNYQPVAMEDVPPGPPAEIPTEIFLRWRKTGGELRLKLLGPTTADRVDPEAFRFFDRLPPALRDQARQIDAHLTPAGDSAETAKGTLVP